MYIQHDRQVVIATYLIKSGNPPRGWKAGRIFSYRASDHNLLYLMYILLHMGRGGKTAIYLVYCMYHYTIGLEDPFKLWDPQRLFPGARLLIAGR